jgi:hypothetical protein
MARCNTIAKYDEIQHKESYLKFKEPCLEQVKTLLQNQIINFTDDLNRNFSELNNIRRETNVKTVAIETKLAEKIEELKIANSNSNYLTEMNAELTANVEDLTASSQTRLANLYKESCDESNSQQK